MGTTYIMLVILDAEDCPIACEKRVASILRGGVAMDYVGACRIVRELKEKLEARLSQPLERCTIAMSVGTNSSLRTHTYVAGNAGVQVISVLGESAAANAIYHVSDGVVVDISGGTAGLAVLRDGKMVQIEDGPTGGTYLTLVLTGSYQIPVAEAGAVRLDSPRHAEIFPIVEAVVGKMMVVVKKYVSREAVSAIYLYGGTCYLTGAESVFEGETRIPTYKPEDPFLVTPAGIATNCIEK